jgi:hypothetical protein
LLCCSSLEDLNKPYMFLYEILELHLLSARDFLSLI